MAKRHLKRVVVGIVAGITKVIQEQIRDAAIFVPLLGTLQTLHKINSVDEDNMIPLETFYVDNLTDVFDLKMDYLQWVNSKNKGLEHSEFFWTNYSFIMNGIAKGELLKIEAYMQMNQSVLQSTPHMNILGMNIALGDPNFSLEVRRDHIMEDTLNAVSCRSAITLRKPLHVTFSGEEAEDHGGVKKEFFMILFEKIFLPEYGMFVENEESNLVWFSGIKAESSSFDLVGKLAGLAVYNSVLAFFPFPLAIYKLLLGKKDSLTLEDLSKLAPTEGRGLHNLLDYDGEDVEEVFCLNFTITYTIFGAPSIVELKPGGEKESVTSSNKVEYVKLYVQARLLQGYDNEISSQIEEFCAGFRSVVASRVISLFQPTELMEMIIGNENYDWDKFRKKMEYKGAYHARHPTILAFWDAFYELSLEERKNFLQFLSGSTRLPVRGMDDFEARIQPCASHLLPVAHTCFNLLDLPDLPDKVELLRRLRISITNTRGFSLV